ncbi:MAG: flavin reductase [Oscillospiraceae bacterium]|jgi:flavin reductase (DIM6/NTAB) family NADH-FMN oxidoreductase RutF/rubredoxin|nr:flavin reductase [Oscillospiraceae bacterium]
MDNTAFFDLTYGLAVIASKGDGHTNGMIDNTFIQVTQEPLRAAVLLTKGGATHGMIAQSGLFTASVLSEKAGFDVFKHFGFRSGADCGFAKFDGTYASKWDANAVPYLTEVACAAFSCKVFDSVDLGTHTMFLADITDAVKLSKDKPLTYADYHSKVKPKAPVSPPPAQASAVPTGWRCKICGYVYEGAVLPEGYVCPLCKHGAADFEPIYG